MLVALSDCGDLDDEFRTVKVTVYSVSSSRIQLSLVLSPWEALHMHWIMYCQVIWGFYYCQ